MKKILRVLSLILTLALLLSVPVFAEEDPPPPPPDPAPAVLGGPANGSGDDGKITTGTKEKRDGFLASKSGYIVYTSGANGVATSPIVAFCWNGGSPYSTTGAPIVLS